MSWSSAHRHCRWDGRPTHQPGGGGGVARKVPNVPGQGWIRQSALMPTSLTAAMMAPAAVISALSEIMRLSQVPLQNAVRADGAGHGRARGDGRRVIRGNGRLPLITPRGFANNAAVTGGRRAGLARL